jgi:hypothetical protein
MKTIWTQHLNTQEEREEFKKTILGSTKVLDRLREILYNKVYTQESNLPTADYDSPSWAYKQADRNGYLRAHKELLDLLVLTKD